MVEIGITLTKFVTLPIVIIFVIVIVCNKLAKVTGIGGIK